MEEIDYMYIFLSRIYCLFHYKNETKRDARLFKTWGKAVFSLC